MHAVAKNGFKSSPILKQFHRYGLKEHAAVDTDNGFILSTTLSPASHNDSPYLPRAVIYSMHTKEKIKIVYADKGYPGAPNRNFLALNKIKDGIMRKDEKNAKLTDLEIERNKGISKLRYIVEQYFGIRHRYDNGNKARFPEIMKNIIDIMFRQFAFRVNQLRMFASRQKKRPVITCPICGAEMKIIRRRISLPLFA